jgi:hypothetical protein
MKFKVVSNKSAYIKWQEHMVKLWTMLQFFLKKGATHKKLSCKQGNGDIKCQEQMSKKQAP